MVLGGRGVVGPVYKLVQTHFLPFVVSRMAIKQKNQKNMESIQSASKHMFFEEGLNILPQKKSQQDLNKMNFIHSL